VLQQLIGMSPLASIELLGPKVVGDAHSRVAKLSYEDGRSSKSQTALLAVLPTCPCYKEFLASASVFKYL
jgi:hypothetical protein